MTDTCTHEPAAKADVISVSDLMARMADALSDISRLHYRYRTGRLSAGKLEREAWAKLEALFTPFQDHKLVAQ